MKIDNNQNFDQPIIEKILLECNIVVNEIKSFQSNQRVRDYLLDDKLMLRLSNSSLDEIQKLIKVTSLSGVQKVYFHGSVVVKGSNINYIILDFFHGINLYDAIPLLEDDDSIHIGKRISDVLKSLHQIKGVHYDIGHYIPTIPHYESSWKTGHIAYINLLETQIQSFDFSLEKKEIIDSAFNYIHDHIDSLNYEEGPVLLHNDLHPKNIIIDKNRFVGVIDWECSQFGEYDFDFVNLLHWCIYPSDSNRSFEKLLESVLHHHHKIWLIPRLSERLTIYQLEHEINQIIWSNGNKVEDRINRIVGWLSGKTSQLLQKLSSKEKML